MKLNTTQKTRHYIFLAVLLIFSLTTLSCGLLGGGDKEEESKATQLPAAEATKAAAEKATPAEEQPTKPPASPSGKTGMFANPEESLDSYRMRTKMTLVEGEGILGEEMITEIAWVRDPEARHTTMYAASGEVMMEFIIIGDETWTSMDGETWMHTTATPGEEESAMPGDFQTSMEDLMKDMESGIKKAGKDKVDGVSCQEYDVDADFSLSFPVPEDTSAKVLQFMPQEMAGHIKGKICVADKRGLPEVIVRSVTTQEMTLKYASGKEETMVYDEDREMYDINERIDIKPPEGQVEEMPSMPIPPADLPIPPASGEGPAQPGESVTYAELNELDSYHLEWSVTVKTGDEEISTSYEYEWTKAPPATHLTVNMFGTIQEYIWLKDEVWMKVGDSEWMMGSKEDMEDAINQVGNIMSVNDDMVFVDEETVNGVKCKHYANKLTIQSQTIDTDVWGANQNNLPPVVIRSIMNHQIKTDTVSMTTVTEGNVTDINTSITIKAPK
jgi:hypothetical protein